MCSKLISAKTERSVGFCSRPRTKARCNTNEIDIGVAESLDSTAHKYHTIVLFKQPTLTGQICCAPKGGIPIELQVPQGIHKEHLCQVFAAGVVCHYEWCWEKQNIPCVCRTTLLPLTGPEGKVAEVLSITRDISTWVGPSTSLHSTLHEGGTPKTFAQLLLAARETEKREVAKALHDEIGTASVMLSALISLVRQSGQKGDVSRTLKDLERLQTQTQQSMQRLHAIIISLRPPSLDTDGALRGSLETLIAEMCKLGRLEYRFVCAANMSEKGISDQVKILLYRIVQEALNNVVKHAKAREVKVTLKKIKGELLLEVKDNGIGFVYNKRRSINHIGLLAMKNSVLLLGGKLEIVSVLGKGTIVRAVCPCIVYEENK